MDSDFLYLESLFSEYELIKDSLDKELLEVFELYDLAFPE